MLYAIVDVSLVGTNTIHSVNESSKAFPFCVSLTTVERLQDAIVTVYVDFLQTNNAERKY